MTVVDEYLETLQGREKEVLGRMYLLVRKLVPDATEELSYAMPSFLYKGRGLVAVMATKKFLSLYPFCAVERLGLDLSAYEGTKGSIHFSADQPLPDKLLGQIVYARMQMIDKNS